MQHINCNHPDANQAEQMVTQQQQRYQSKTLQQQNSARYVYLPFFPFIVFGANASPLLANVPSTYCFLLQNSFFVCTLVVLVTRLTRQEITRRQQGASTAEAMTLMNKYKYSLEDPFILSEKDAQDLATYLNVGLAIITFNAEQLRGICYRFLVLRETYRRDVIHLHDVDFKELTLNSQEMIIALEFFLQFDGKSSLYLTADTHSTLIHHFHVVFSVSFVFQSMFSI